MSSITQTFQAVKEASRRLNRTDEATINAVMSIAKAASGVKKWIAHS